MENITFPLSAILIIISGYLYGSVNYAIIVTRLTTGKDIRLLGNKNPGAANVARTVGRGRAALVLFLDMSKSLVPLILGRRLFFTEISLPHYIVLFATAIAAICGHCLPVYYRFKGGGGIATSLGVFLFFIPGEFVLAVLAGFVIVLIFIKTAQFRLSQWVPVMFVFLAPVFTSILNLVPSLRIAGTALTGGHPRYVTVGVWAVSGFILLMNLTFMKNRLSELKGNPPE